MSKLFDETKLKAIAKTVLTYANACGADAAEVNIAVAEGFSLTVRQQETEELTHHRNCGAVINLYKNRQRGVASCSDLRPEALEASVKAAWEIAQQTDADPYAGLADKSLMAKHFPDLKIYYPWDISPAKGIELAKTCEQAALECRQVTNSEGANLSTQVSCDVYANTNDFCEATLSTHHSLSCTVVAEKNGGMQRDYSYLVGVDPAAVSDVISIGKEAAYRTVRRLGAKPLQTQRAPVIFAADVARSLLGHFISAISGGTIYRQTSFLVDCLGKKIFPEHITIFERPYLLSALGSTAFDSEGVATREQDFICNGVLERYLLGTYSAKRLGLETTANADGAHNLMISHGDSDLKTLLKKMGTGFLVTELLGQGANLITGDYSRGASGFWIENGEIVHPVTGVTVAGNLKDMYQKILAVGNDVDIRGNIRTGSIWIESMMIGGE